MENGPKQPNPVQLTPRQRRAIPLILAEKSIEAEARLDVLERTVPRRKTRGFTIGSSSCPKGTTVGAFGHVEAR